MTHTCTKEWWSIESTTESGRWRVIIKREQLCDVILLRAHTQTQMTNMMQCDDCVGIYVYVCMYGCVCMYVCMCMCVCVRESKYVRMFVWVDVWANFVTCRESFSTIKSVCCNIMNTLVDFVASILHNHHWSSIVIILN